MTASLTTLQKRLCNILQDGIEICPEPFAKIAQTLDLSQDLILQQIRELKEKKIIRRFRAMINYRALGKAATLVTAHVPDENITEVAQAVNLLAGVSHNYLRKHYYNLWFTLQGQSQGEIEKIVSELSVRFGTDFHSLPVEKTFKLDVRFDAANNETTIEKNTIPLPKENKIELTEKEKIILTSLQKEIEPVERPFDFIRNEKLTEKDVLRILKDLKDKGVISRIGVVLDQNKIGFTANVMFACSVPEERISQAGKLLAQFSVISHCYQRKTFEGWPYNLFAMMHAKSMGDIQRIVDEFTESEKIESYELLPTITEFKKHPVEYQL